MVTVLDAGLIGQFGSVFTFLFILVLVYAILGKLNIFKSQAVNTLIGVIVAVLAVSSRTVVNTIRYATPWLVFFLFLLFFIVVVFLFLGSTMDNMPISPVKQPGIAIIILLIIILIFIFSASQANQEEKQRLNESGLLEDKGPTPLQKTTDIIRHPAVLGLFITFMIATFTIMLVAVSPKPK